MMGFLVEAMAFFVGNRAVDSAETKWPRAVAIGLPAVTVVMFVALLVLAAAQKGAPQ